MTKKLFAEHELYLLNNFADVVEFEDSVASVRETYQRILKDVLKRVADAHEECDSQQQRFGNSTLNLGLGKKTWSKYPDWPTGIWLQNLWIEDLVKEDENHPGCAVWIQHPSHISLDLADAVNRLQQAAKSILPQEDFQQLNCDWKKSSAYIEYPFRQSRQELFSMLLKDDAKEFSECLIEHFELLSQFLPILDEIFQNAQKSRK